MHNVKNVSTLDDDDDLHPVIVDYFKYYAKDHLDRGANQGWHLFPHREYDPIKFGQLAYVPLKYTAKKIIKIFRDYFKPYKSTRQLAQDFKQPLVAIAILRNFLKNRCYR